MNEVKRIAVPIDFLANTDKLLDFAIYVANLFGASVHLLHIVPPFPADTMIGAPFAMEYQEKLLASANEQMSNTIEDYAAKTTHQLSGEIAIGDPSEKITERARAQDVGLIIISTHGAKGLERIMLGSVAERVLKRAHCPVLIMNPFKP